MGRPLRIDAPGTWHHVMNRGAGRRLVFRSDEERVIFLDLVGKLEERFEVEVHSYCLMGNHYHLVLRSRSGRLSDAMAWVGSNFTRSVNTTRCVDGSIFRGRFHSVTVHRESHLDWLFRYVNANPADLGWTEPFSEYPWSGLAVLLGRRDDASWLRSDFVRSRFGEDPDALEAFVERGRYLGAAGDSVVRIAPDQEVADAVELARAPGPQINTDAQVRAAHTFIRHRLGACPSEMSTIAGLEVGGQQQYLGRSIRRAETDVAVAALVARADEVLEVASASNQRVPDTR